MGFFARLFGRSTPAPETTYGAGPAAATHGLALGEGNVRKIGYDPHLIHDLKSDHHSLIKIYIDIRSAVERQNLSDIPSLLSDLKLAFQTHIMVENVRFYTYLQQNLSHDPEITTFLGEVRREMDGISRVLVKFINTYTLPNVLNPTSLTQFKIELGNIGDVLTKRIQLEEHRLYTLYMPEY